MKVWRGWRVYFGISSGHQPYRIPASLRVEQCRDWPQLQSIKAIGSASLLIEIDGSECIFASKPLCASVFTLGLGLFLPNIYLLPSFQHVVRFIALVCLVLVLILLFWFSVIPEPPENQRAKHIITHPDNSQLVSTLPNGTPALDVGFHIRGKSSKTLATSGRGIEADIFVEGRCLVTFCHHAVDIGCRRVSAEIQSV